MKPFIAIMWLFWFCLIVASMLLSETANSRACITSCDRQGNCYTTCDD
jgi:hypothetical protein